jgi:hypothetical protein
MDPSFFSLFLVNKEEEREKGPKTGKTVWCRDIHN